MTDWNSPTMTAANAPSPYVVSASSESTLATYKAWKAFDGNSGTFWNAPTAPPNVWIMLDCGVDSNYVAKACAIKNYAKLGLKDFKVQGSNNGSDWTDLLSDTAANNTTVQNFSFSGNSTVYRYYRILCITGHHSAELDVYEISFSGIEEGGEPESNLVINYHYSQKMMG